MASFPQVETASVIRTESITGVHLFKVIGYSLIKATATWPIHSEVFTIGGYEWAIEYYPNGSGNPGPGFLSFFLVLKSEDAHADVKARYTFTILEHDGTPSDMTMTSGICNFRGPYGMGSSLFSSGQFAKVTTFEESKCLKDDAFTLKCTVTVVKDTKLEAISPYGVAVPPSNLTQNLSNLLESGEGADIIFVLNGDCFKAHRWMLAARSGVFKEELLGGIKERSTNAILVEDIEAPVFKSMLYFIYTDSVPDFEGTSDVDSDKENMRLMAQQLLYAADRYELERLKFMCQDVLCKNLGVSNAGTALILAERYNCSHLKAQCLKFMSSAEVFKGVALTPEFQYLLTVCPSVLKDFKALKLKC